MYAQPGPGDAGLNLCISKRRLCNHSSSYLSSKSSGTPLPFVNLAQLELRPSTRTALDTYGSVPPPISIESPAPYSQTHTSVCSWPCDVGIVSEGQTSSLNTDIHFPTSEDVTVITPCCSISNDENIAAFSHSDSSSDYPSAPMLPLSPTTTSSSTASSTTTSNSPSTPEFPQHTCRYCNRSFKAPGDRNRHLKQHEKPFPCAISGCVESFRYRKDRNRHYRSKRKHPDLAASATLYLCCALECSFVSRRLDSWQRHAKGRHAGSDAEYLEI